MFEWAVSLPVLLTLSFWLIRQGDAFEQDLPAIVTWLAAVVVTDLLRVPLWNSIVLTMSLPVVLGAGIELGPGEAALVALLGSMDPREWRRQVSLGRAVFNRCQVALAVFMASAAFVLLGGERAVWPSLLPAFGVMVLVDLVVNLGLVVISTRLATEQSWSGVVRRIIGDAPGEQVKS